MSEDKIQKVAKLSLVTYCGGPSGCGNPLVTCVSQVLKFKEYFQLQISMQTPIPYLKSD